MVEMDEKCGVCREWKKSCWEWKDHCYKKHSSETRLMHRHADSVSFQFGDVDGMVERCKGCRKWREQCREWEKHWYWKHSSMTRFTAILGHDFFERLLMPKKFVEHFKEELCGTASLEGPSGNIWNVGLIRSANDIFLLNSWDKFVEDHFLAEGDLLLFEHIRDSHFKVFMFDGCGCEKECSYFIGTCNNVIFRREKRKNPGKPKNDSPPRKVFRCTRQAKHEINNLQDNQPSVHANQFQSIEKVVVATRSVLSKRGKSKSSRGSLEQPDNTDNEHKSFKSRKHISNQKPSETTHTRRAKYSTELISKRRPVTNEERDRALSSASALELVNPSFTVVMQQTHVYRRFYMIIPVGFIRRHLANKDQIIELCGPSGRTMEAGFLARKPAGISKGWFHFVVENRVEEGDACVFELLKTRGKVKLDVHIFRVVEEAVPPTLLRNFRNNTLQKRRSD